MSRLSDEIGIPKRFRWCTDLATADCALVDKIRPIDAHGNAIPIAWLLPRVVGMRATNAVFMGPSGSGKSCFAIAALMGRWHAAPISPLFVTARALAGSSLTAPDLLDRSLSADLLLIDDLGNESQDMSEVVHVIRERHDENLATWITTGFDLGDLCTFYGAGIVRRLFEGAAIFRFGFQQHAPSRPASEQNEASVRDATARSFAAGCATESKRIAEWLERQGSKRLSERLLAGDGRYSSRKKPTR